MTEKITLELTKEEFYALDRNIMMVEETESILEKIKEGYKKLDPPKSPVEEAYKKVYGYYPDIGFGTGFSLVYWDVFQKAYEQAQKDYKVGEYQDPEKEREEPKTLFDVIRNLGYSVDCSWEIVDAIEEFEKQKIKENLKTSLQEMVNGDVRPIDDVIKEAKEEPKKTTDTF